MRRLLFLIICLMSLAMFGCNQSEEVLFEEAIEYVESAEVINSYIDDNRVRGYGKYSFVDLRGYSGTHEDYVNEQSYLSVHISVFKNAPWLGDDDSKSRVKELVSNKSHNFPIVLMDYDGSYVEAVKDYLESIGYHNIKMFKYGMFDLDNGYKVQMGSDFERYTTSGNEDCDC